MELKITIIKEDNENTVVETVDKIYFIDFLTFKKRQDMEKEIDKCIKHFMKKVFDVSSAFVNTEENASAYEIWFTPYFEYFIHIELNNNPIENFNHTLLEYREKTSLEFTNPKVGDFVLRDGIYRRIASIHNNINVFQTSIGIEPFFIYSTGECELFGPNDFESYSLNSLKTSNETKLGKCWIYSKDIVKPNNKVEYFLDFKVWTLN